MPDVMPTSLVADCSASYRQNH